jgi:hypothetical protein
MIASEGRKTLPDRTSRRAKRTIRIVACAGLFVSTGLLIAAGVLAEDPDWTGTPPDELSEGIAAVQPAVEAGPADRLVVAWSERSSAPSSTSDIYVTESGSGGALWSEPEVISPTVGQSLLPDVSVAGEHTAVAWVDQVLPTLAMEVYVAERSGDAAPWDVHPVPVLPSHRYIDRWPRLASGPARLYVVFNGGPDGGVPDILYASRSLSGGAWSTATLVHTHTWSIGGSWYPALAIGPDGQTVHVAWEERRGLASGSEILYLTGTVAGPEVTWHQPPVTLSPPQVQWAAWPDIAVDSGGNVHAVWGEQVQEAAAQCGDAPYEQYVGYTRFDARSGEWLSPTVRIHTDPVCVNDKTPRNAAPRVVLRGQQPTVCVVWHGYRPGGEAAEEVLLSCASYLPLGWSVPASVSRSPGSEAMSIIPSIAADARSRLHIVWQERTGDSTLDDYQAYYSGSPRLFLPLVARR